MGIRQALHAVPVILLTVLGNAHCAPLHIRGLDPSLAEYYKQSGDSFKCLDGQRTIKYSLINDNYCDCFDGSDEPGEPLITFPWSRCFQLVSKGETRIASLLFPIPPHFAVLRLNHTSTVSCIFWRSWFVTSLGRAGTSACVHGKFYCRNRGYTSQLLNASMIDDGFCGRLHLMPSVSTASPASGCWSLHVNAEALRTSALWRQQG